MEYFQILNMQMKNVGLHIIILQRRYFETFIFRTIMAEKRKSAHKCPFRCRRNRLSTPALDLLSPYLPGPELFISPPILAIQMRPAYSSASFDSSVNSASSLPIRYAPYSSANPTLSFDSNPIPSNSSLFHTESRVVQDLSVRSTAPSVPPPHIDWYGPSRPSTSYMVSTQSNLMTSTSSNSQSGVQRFFKNSGCLTIHWTVFLEGFLMLFQVQPFPVVTSK